MSVQKYRLEKAWSQEELAYHAGVSVRTIQRIESGKTASLETLKCLAAVLETNVSDLMTQERTMPETIRPETTTVETIETAATEQPHTNQTRTYSSIIASQETEAIEYVKNLKGFYIHLLVFLICSPGLAILNYVISPQFYWFIFAVIPWGFAILLHGLITHTYFRFLGPDWEERQFRKRMRDR